MLKYLDLYSNVNPTIIYSPSFLMTGPIDNKVNETSLIFALRNAKL